MSIAKQVLDDFEANGRLAVPDGMKAVAASSRMSSDDNDKRRLLHLVFEDGSELSLDTRGSRLSMSCSQAGEADYSLAPA